jgi:hypothetical protein
MLVRSSKALQRLRLRRSGLHSVTLLPHVFLLYPRNLSNALKYAEARSAGRWDCDIAFSQMSSLLIPPIIITDYYL